MREGTAWGGGNCACRCRGGLAVLEAKGEGSGSRRGDCSSAPRSCSPRSTSSGSPRTSSSHCGADNDHDDNDHGDDDDDDDDGKEEEDFTLFRLLSLALVLSLSLSLSLPSSALLVAFLLPLGRLGWLSLPISFDTAVMIGAGSGIGFGSGRGSCLEASCGMAAQQLISHERFAQASAKSKGSSSCSGVTAARTGEGKGAR